MSENSRRKLLKSLAAGSGAVIAGKSLPDSWSRPVVDSVMLPAHAQTSLLNSSGAANQVQVVNGFFDIEDDSLLANVADLLVPEAQAFYGSPIQQPLTCVDHVLEGPQHSPQVAHFSAMAIYGEKCPHTYLFNAQNVPVKGDFQKTYMPYPTSPCYDIVDNGGLLEKTGLINNAHANGEPPWVAIQTFSGPNGGAHGQFYDGMGNLFNFSLFRGICPAFTPVCGDCDS